MAERPGAEPYRQKRRLSRSSEDSSRDLDALDHSIELRESTDQQIATVASKELWEISWGKPKDIDPNAEKPAGPDFNPRDYSPEQLDLTEAALRLLLNPPKPAGAEPAMIMPVPGSR